MVMRHQSDLGFQNNGFKRSGKENVKGNVTNPNRSNSTTGRSPNSVTGFPSLNKNIGHGVRLPPLKKSSVPNLFELVETDRNSIYRMLLNNRGHNGSNKTQIGRSVLSPLSRSENSLFKRDKDYFDPTKALSWGSSNYFKRNTAVVPGIKKVLKKVTSEQNNLTQQKYLDSKESSETKEPSQGLSLEIDEINYSDPISDETKLLTEVKHVSRVPKGSTKEFYTIMTLNDDSKLILLNSLKKNSKHEKIIGQGKEGKVRYAIYINNNETHQLYINGTLYPGRYVAVKKTLSIDDYGTNLKQGITDRFQRTENTLENRLYDIAEIQSKCASEADSVLPVFQQFKDPDRFKAYTVSPIMRGTLEDSQLVKECFLQQPNLFADRIKELLRGVNSIHNNGYLHRDLSPDNIFISDEGKLMIGDFGTVVKSDKETIMFRGKQHMIDAFISCDFKDVVSDPEISQGYFYSKEMEVVIVGICIFKSLFNFRERDFGQNVSELQDQMKIVIEGLEDNKTIDEITIDDSYSYIKERLKTLIETNGFDNICKLVNFMDNFLEKDPKVRKNLDQLVHEFCELFPDQPESKSPRSIFSSSIHYEPLDSEALKNSYKQILDK